MKGLSHSELWINTKYFVDAIRCVCSLLYLQEHADIWNFIDSDDFVDGKLHRFYINLCSLIDIHCELTKSKSKRPVYKKMLCTMCPSLNWLFYERDKNAAHKDVNYRVNQNVSPDKQIVKMKKAVDVVKHICDNIISSSVSVFYYSYDPLLFRYVNGITPVLEAKLNDLLYMKVEYNENNSKLFRIIWDPRQVRDLSPKQDYCVAADNGLMLQPYDMLQHREDFCIRLNAWHGCDAWVHFDDTYSEELLSGFFDMLEDLKHDRLK